MITGGESGSKSRPISPGWASSIREQCTESGTTYFHKQNGGTKMVDGTWGGRMLDGRTWDEIPQRHVRDLVLPLRGGAQH